jgi:hypothetical protein
MSNAMVATGNELCFHSERRKVGTRRGAGGFDAKLRRMTLRDLKSTFRPWRPREAERQTSDLSL